MVSTRIKAVHLMEALQPFTQGEVLSPEQAQNIVHEYVAGNTTPIRDFVYNPDIPAEFINVTKRLLQFI